MNAGRRRNSLGTAVTNRAMPRVSGRVTRKSASAIPVDEAVQLALASAIERGRSVTVVLRGGDESGQGERTLEGVPAAFRPTANGRPRVVISVGNGVDQVLLMARIARVIPR